MSSTPRRRNLRGHGGLLRDEILSAATRVIDGADSEGEVSLRSIAREAGIAAPSVYAHFDDRDRVLEAVAESSWVQVSDEIAEHVQAATDPRERLLIGCRVYVSFAQRHPLRYALMTQDGQAPPAARQALATVTRALLACRGEVPGPCGGPSFASPSSSLAEPPDSDAVSDPDSDRIAAALSVALHGVAMLHRTDSPNLWLSDFNTDEVIRTLVDAATLLLVDATPA
ncbi:TetR/AcrR family transcriptional regulator [[Mycobacterium] nativiensis]|uniref:TetR/AcrR family transcriptional regulator n=1 Tax=[Mycobacterium] nativiensis TaxID=2855503 RepID=A0ABU5Y087_9MYCO|nr:TetR/AcrR family transcriptional regulator [Mycolicibacter sp. MYC340]MEB3033659.1 TetR/AcrR family transcriptional regulator [Mycolicibacter sp. MYC340]